MAAVSEITELDDAELETRLTESRRELFNLRFQLATGQLDNYSRMVLVRKDIARLMTERRAREIAEAEGLAAEAIPAHRAVARRQRADEEAGRVRVPAAERRAAARAAAERDDDIGHEEDDPLVVDAVIDEPVASADTTEAVTTEADEADTTEAVTTEADEADTTEAVTTEADEVDEVAGPESEEES
jgi:large subunit ribosomal protein L29